MTEIVAICLKKRAALTSDGDLLPITDFIDRFGEPVDDEAEATFVIAGPDKNGTWWRMGVKEFETGTLH